MGDGSSDLPLLQAAGIGVAMGNATEAVKAGADIQKQPKESGRIRDAKRLLHLGR